MDTNICIYFLKGRYNLIERFENIGFDNLFISEITVAELKYGAAKSTYPEKNRRIINGLTSKFSQLPIYSALDIYAIEKARLKRLGQTVDDFDVLIGATAIVNEMVLVTNNEKHFIRLKNINIENWTVQN
ncbi:MAG: type II toxin-antitoxin system VapC family toxin [Cyclobacteriaceae bacterium]|nr:type II toxin-antitoxin system VapC family toxin [Cyclobacteriaceae bacterium]